MAFYATVIACTCERGGWQFDSATISILSHGIMVFDMVGMTLLVIPMVVSILTVAMVAAVIGLIPVRCKFIRFMRQILLKGIVDNFYEIFQVIILTFDTRIDQ